MPLVLKVSWVDRTDDPDPFLRVRRIGGASGALQWQHPCNEAIEAIDRGQFHYYVEQGNRLWKLEVAEAPNGFKYLKTQADETLPQCLLGLPQGPNPASGPNASA